LPRPPRYYTLKGKHPIPCASLDEWVQIIESTDRQVAQTEIDEVRISTVFLGLDHNYRDEGPPLLFETMIFGGGLNGNQWRCSTWEQAKYTG
jgi:hypothetical protein